MDFALRTRTMVTVLPTAGEDSAEDARPPGTAELARLTTLAQSLPDLTPLLRAHALLLGVELPPPAAAAAVPPRLGIHLEPKATTPRHLAETTTQLPPLEPTPMLLHLARRPLLRVGQRVRPLPVH
jgi:hypothetical protein